MNLSHVSQQVLWATPAAGALALAYAFKKSRDLRVADEGTDAMRAQALHLQSDGWAMLRKEARWLAPFLVGLAAGAAGWSAAAPGGHPLLGATVLAGALLSAAAGLFAWRVAARALARATHAARTTVSAGAEVAFHGGLVIGHATVALSLIGLCASIVALFESDLAGDDWRRLAGIASGFAWGAAGLAVFTQVGRGVFAQGASLASQVRDAAQVPDAASVTERDPSHLTRDAGGLLSAVSGASSGALASLGAATLGALVLGLLAHDAAAAVLALALVAAGEVVSIVAALFVRFAEGIAPGATLHRGALAGGFLMALVGVGLVRWLVPEGLEVAGVAITWPGIAVALVAGVAAGALVRAVAPAFVAGPDALVETRAAWALLSGLAPALALIAAVATAFATAGGYGVALAAVGFVATAGLQLAHDTQAALAASASGFATRGGLEPAARGKAVELEASARATVAMGRSVGLAGATFAGFALLFAYAGQAELNAADLFRPAVLTALLGGVTLPFLCASWLLSGAVRAGADAARDHGVAPTAAAAAAAGRRARLSRGVEIAWATALRRAVGSSVLAIGVPSLLGVFDPHALAGLLLGSLCAALVLGSALALSGDADGSRKSSGYGILRGEWTAQAIGVFATLMCATAVAIAPLLR